MGASPQKKKKKNQNAAVPINRFSIVPMLNLLLNGPHKSTLFNKFEILSLRVLIEFILALYRETKINYLENELMDGKGTKI